MDNLLTLLIHFRTREEYYADLEKAKHREIVRIEKQQGQPFDTLPEGFKETIQSKWYWPPWRFNDIVGYAVIRLENEWTMVADLYLPNKRITRASRAQFFHLNYVVTQTLIETYNLQNIRDGIYRIISQLEDQLKEKDWHLEYNRAVIDNTDFLTIIEERKK